MEAVSQASEPAPALVERDDAALVDAYRAGAEAAFAELVRRHQIPVFRLLLGLTSDADEAEALCEQVFFAAAKRFSDFKGPQPFGAWLLALSRELSRKAEEKRPQVTAPRRPMARPRDPKALVKHEVKTALNELTSDERVALILADLEGDSFDSIGQTLGTSAEEAAQIVHTARTKFQRGLEDAGTAPEGARDDAAQLEPGALLDGRFRIESFIAKGGMGAVYRAVDARSGENVAIKTLLPAAQADAAARRRFEREAEIIERLQHPNFVRLIAHGRDPAGTSYVAMELISGAALDQLIEREARLEPRRALHIVRHLLEGLTYAHAQGVIHRDLKPQNVMVVRHDEDADFAKMLDLGIAKLMGPEDARRTRLTQQGELMGTPLYISPEMLRGEALDGRADLYSLTVLLYEMLAARPPFEASTSTALFAMHLVTPPPPLAELVPDLAVPAQLEQLLQLGLAKDPSARIGSAQSYRDRIDDLLRLDWERIASGPRSKTTAPRRPARLGGTRFAVAAPVAAITAPAGPFTRALRFVLRSRSTLVTVVLSVLALIGLVYWMTHDVVTR